MAAPREIDGLRSSFAAGRALGDDAGTHDWIEADVAFHSSIYALSGNPAIAETVADRWPHFKRGMGVALANPAWRKSVWVEHVAITERILAGDAGGALAAAVYHSENAGAHLFARLTSEVRAP